MESKTGEKSMIPNTHQWVSQTWTHHQYENRRRLRELWQERQTQEIKRLEEERARLLEATNRLAELLTYLKGDKAA